MNTQRTKGQAPTIRNFSLNTLMEINHQNDRQGLMRDCIITDNESTFPELDFPFRINAFIFGIGLDGEATASFNLHDYRLRKNSFFCFGQQSILQPRTNEGFRARIIALSPDLLRRITIDTKKLLPYFSLFSAHPVLDVTPQEVRELNDFISLIDTELRNSESDLTSDIVNELITALLYKVGDLLSRYLAVHPEVANRHRNRAEEYFRRFMQLLGEHFKQERNVGFYARQLCITPKYLTTQIKRISGKSVSEWIDIFVVLEAKTLLKYSDQSIQEISYALNFPNQSFFGCYFKRITGMSPTQYKLSGE